MDNGALRYQIDTPENRAWLTELREGLLRWGRGFPSPGGSAYYLGDDGTPLRERPREPWITSRMAHVYSLGAMLGETGEEQDVCRELCGAGVRGLRQELHDDHHGGWYAGINADGTVIDRKECYAHAFVILAGTSAVLAGCPGAEELLRKALAVHEEHFWEEEAGLAVDSWDRTFRECAPYRGFNANMHTAEAFLAAADTLERTDPRSAAKYRGRAGRIIDRVIGWASANGWRIPEHFDTDWRPDLEFGREKPDDPFKPYGATPGHAIETARLIVQYATVDLRAQADYAEDKEPVGDGEWERRIRAAECLYDRAVKDAWKVDGEPGFVYTTDWDGRPIVHDRMHWTLAEAINASAVLYRVTGAARYADDYAEFLSYLDKCVLDHAQGSWFHQLDRKNQVIGTVWPGKPDLYHAVQATLIPYNEEVGVSVAAAVSRLHQTRP